MPHILRARILDRAGDDITAKGHAAEGETTGQCVGHAVQCDRPDAVGGKDHFVGDPARIARLQLFGIHGLGHVQGLELPGLGRRLGGRRGKGCRRRHQDGLSQFAGQGQRVRCGGWIRRSQPEAQHLGAGKGP